MKTIFNKLAFVDFFHFDIETKIGNRFDHFLSKDELKKLDKNQIMIERSMITPENWNDYKDIFFKQKMDTYKDCYSLNRKIELELEALDNLALNTPDNKVLVKDYKDYLNNIEKPQTETSKLDEVKKKKISEKWYALLYWIELNANGQRPPINNEGGFIKSEIKKIGIEKIGTTGQSFYRKFIEIDLNNEKKLSGIFGKDWKEKIIHLSNNNQTIIDYIGLKFKK